MRKSVLMLACLGLLAVSLCASADEPCRYSAPRNAEIDAAGLKLLSVEIGPDRLVIHGQPGLSKIEVKGTACASDKDWLDRVKLETARHGDTARLVAHDGDHGNSFFSLFNLVKGGTYAYLKLAVSVPQALAVKLDMGSGDAHVRNVAALDASVGSGDLHVDSVAGKFGLSVGSGDAEAHDVGSLDGSGIGSGDASVDGVHGDARISAVGSGDFHLRNVKGKVSLGSVASGDAKISGAGGSVSIDSVGSGDLDIRDVTGDVSVGSVSSGDVEVKRASGNVHVGSIGSGDFEVFGVGGTFTVDTIGSGDASHHGVKGKVSIPRNDD